MILGSGFRKISVQILSLSVTNKKLFSRSWTLLYILHLLQRGTEKIQQTETEQVMLVVRCQGKMHKRTFYLSSSQQDTNLETDTSAPDKCYKLGN